MLHFWSQPTMFFKFFCTKNKGGIFMQFYAATTAFWVPENANLKKKWVQVYEKKCLKTVLLLLLLLLTNPAFI